MAEYKEYYKLRKTEHIEVEVKEQYWSKSLSQIEAIVQEFVKEFDYDFIVNDHYDGERLSEALNAALTDYENDIYSYSFVRPDDCSTNDCVMISPKIALRINGEDEYNGGGEVDFHYGLESLLIFDESITKEEIGEAFDWYKNVMSNVQKSKTQLKQNESILKDMQVKYTDREVEILKLSTILIKNMKGTLKYDDAFIKDIVGCENCNLLKYLDEAFKLENM